MQILSQFRVLHKFPTIFLQYLQLPPSHEIFFAPNRLYLILKVSELNLRRRYIFAKIAPRLSANIIYRRRRTEFANNLSSRLQFPKFPRLNIFQFR